MFRNDDLSVKTPGQVVILIERPFDVPGGYDCRDWLIVVHWRLTWIIGGCQPERKVDGMTMVA